MHIDVAAYKSNNKSDTDTDRGSSFLFLRPWHKKHNMQHNQSKLRTPGKETCLFIQFMYVKTDLRKSNPDTDRKTLMNNTFVKNLYQNL